jgi:hypothetical protein
VELKTILKIEQAGFIANKKAPEEQILTITTLK